MRNNTSDIVFEHAFVQTTVLRLEGLSNSNAFNKHVDHELLVNALWRRLPLCRLARHLAAALVFSVGDETVIDLGLIDPVSYTCQPSSLAAAHARERVDVVDLNSLGV